MKRVGNYKYYTREEFIKLSEEKYGIGSFDYSEIKDEIIKSNIKQIFICKICGKRLIETPAEHFRKARCHSDSRKTHTEILGCMECYKKEVKRQRWEKNVNIFLEKAIKQHGDNFDYSLVRDTYIDNRHPVKLICKKCGRIFDAIPSHHVRSKTDMCPKCVSEQIGISQRMSEEEFIKRGTEIYGDIFDYSELDYSGITKEITVIDKRTGERLITSAENFLKGAKFGKNHSFLETSVYRCLEAYGIKFSKEVHLKSDIFINREFVRIDVVVERNGNMYYIECNGEQHYKIKATSYFYTDNLEDAIEKYKSQIQRDSDLRKYCKENNIILIEIPYTFYTYNRIKDALVQILIEGKNPDEVIKQPEIEIPV